MSIMDKICMESHGTREIPSPLEYALAGNLSEQDIEESMKRILRTFEISIYLSILSVRRSACPRTDHLLGELIH